MLAAKALQRPRLRERDQPAGRLSRSGRSPACRSVKDKPLTTEQIQRYSRHFLLTQVGEKGQRKLLRSKVLLIGAGGLGSPTALYLAAAGVGTMGLMDGDVVDVSNLQRQILHTTADVGQAQGRVGHARRSEGAESRRQRHLAADAHHRRQRDGHHQGLRPGHRRVGQLRYALSGQRRVLPRRQDQRARLDLPVRGHGHACSPRTRARATAASTRRRRRRGSSPAEARPASWACSQASSGWCRPPRPSSCCSASASR